jgi:N-acyl-L-homoserine lactone synthetase
MFNLIPPKKRAEFSQDIDQMFALLKLEFGENVIDIYDHDKTQYLVYSHKKYGVIGGARLIPIDAPGLTTDLLKRLQFQPKQKMWELSRIFFHLPDTGSKEESIRQYELMRRDFFQNLYDSLKTISIAQKIKGFITILHEDVHKEILLKGFWPFDKQAKITSPFKDGEPYVIGFMPMNDAMYELFIQRRLSFEIIAPIS